MGCNLVGCVLCFVVHDAQNVVTEHKAYRTLEVQKSGVKFTSSNLEKASTGMSLDLFVDLISLYGYVSYPNRILGASCKI